MKYICIFCERQLDRVGPPGGEEHFQPQNGGEVRIIFDFGSRFDWMGSRRPTSSPNATWHEIDFGDGKGPIKFQESDGSEPHPEALNSKSRADRLSACNCIQGVICDDCFEAKAYLFYGFERSPNGDLKELVE